MTVTLYSNRSAENTLHPAISQVGIFNAEIKGVCDVYTPTLYINYNGVDYNYMYCPDFGRYYHLTPPTLLPGGRAMISGRVDVLNSYAAELEQKRGRVIRSETIGLSQIPDQGITTQLKKRYQTITAQTNLIDPSATRRYLLGVI